MLKEKLTGVVKFFNKEKGFGFIRADNSDKEAFVHVSSLRDQVKENDRVEFETRDSDKGLSAVNVRVMR